MTAEQEARIAAYLADEPGAFAAAVLWTIPPTDRALAGWVHPFPHSVICGHARAALPGEQS